MRIIRGGDGHGHSHSHDHHHHRAKLQKLAKSSDNETDDERSETDESKLLRGSKPSKSEIKSSTPSDGHTHLGESTKNSVAWALNLVADMMHNFTDGLAIGASFIAGSKVGIGK